MGGFITPPEEYFRIVAEIVRDHGGVFISDEVQTGFGRTGETWGIDHSGVEPDMITVAKGIANGMPLAAVITTKDISDSLQKNTISTFGGNPVSCTAANATLEIMERDNLKQNANEMGLLLKEGLKKDELTILHCNTEYPTPLNDVNLNAMLTIRDKFDVQIGYSDHTMGIEIPIAAVALGAKIIEKHITLDRSMEGNDHKVSLLPNEFKLMVQGIRELEKALGSDSARVISQGEMLNRIALSKSIVAKHDIEINETIFREMVEIKSPGRGLQGVDEEVAVSSKPGRGRWQQDDIK